VFPAGIVSTKGFGKTSPMMKGNTQEARGKIEDEIAVTESQIKFGDDASTTAK